VLRFVGGRVSKTGEVNINTPAGTIGIRGGVAVIAFINGRWFVAFFYGDYVNVAGIPITRPGFGMNIGDSSPHPLTQQEIAQLLALLQGGNGQPPVPNLVFDPGQRPDWLTPDALQAWLAGLGGTSTGPDRGVDTWGPIIQLLTEGNNQGNRGNLIVPVPPPPPQVLPPPPPPPPPSYF
jgi:hypothetical protein